jgi:hypothetical protein
MKVRRVVLGSITALTVLAYVAVSAPLAHATLAGLVSWWQAEGNANDSVDGNNGTLNGGVTFTAGHPGQAFNFDGSTGYVSIGNPSNLQRGSGDFTIAAWVNFADLIKPSGSPSAPCLPAGCDMSIVNKMVDSTSGGPNTPNRDGWRLAKASDNHFWFCLGSSTPLLPDFPLGNGCAAGETTTARSTTVAVAGIWYQVAGVFSATQGLSIYVNGALEATASGLGAVDTDVADFLIGYYPFESFMYGQIDEAQYFNRALTASEIQQLATASTDFHYHIDGGAPAYTTGTHAGTVSAGTTHNYTVHYTISAFRALQTVKVQGGLNPDKGVTTNPYTGPNGTLSGDGKTYSGSVTDCGRYTIALSSSRKTTSPAGNVVTWSIGPMSAGTTCELEITINSLSFQTPGSYNVTGSWSASSKGQAFTDSSGPLTVLVI